MKKMNSKRLLRDNNGESTIVIHGGKIEVKKTWFLLYENEDGFFLNISNIIR